MATYTKCTADADCKSITAAQADACCAKTTLKEFVAGGTYDNSIMQDAWKNAEANTNMPGTVGKSISTCAISKALISTEISTWKDLGIVMTRECNATSGSTYVKAVFALMSTAVAYASF